MLIIIQDGSKELLRQELKDLSFINSKNTGYGLYIDIFKSVFDLDISGYTINLIQVEPNCVRLLIKPEDIWKIREYRLSQIL